MPVRVRATNEDGGCELATAEHVGSPHPCGGFCRKFSGARGEECTEERAIDVRLRFSARELLLPAETGMPQQTAFTWTVAREDAWTRRWFLGRPTRLAVRSFDLRVAGDASSHSPLLGARTRSVCGGTDAVLSRSDMRAQCDC